MPPMPLRAPGRSVQVSGVYDVIHHAGCKSKILSVTLLQHDTFPVATGCPCGDKIRFRLSAPARHYKKLKLFNPKAAG